MLIQGLIDKVVTNIEGLIIGKYYTTSELGCFSQSRHFNNYVTSNLVSVVQTVTYPALAKLRDDRLKDGYRRVLMITIVLLLPLSVFISVASSNVMVTFFGIQWIGASDYLCIWTIVGLLVAIYSIFINIFLVVGNSKDLLKYSLIRQVLRVASIILLIRQGVYVMLLGILAVTLFSTIQYVYFGGRLIGYSIIEVLKDILPTLFISLISAFVVYLVGFVMKEYSHQIQFAIQSLTMVLVYFLLSHVTNNKAYIEVKDLVVNLLSTKLKKL